ncbi:MAG: adenosine deaminase [Planctomycetes bacterium]|nr:adenosine deaminase [Planctomycetota bacterium]
MTPAQDRRRLKALVPNLPKVDLHLHLDGALRVATIAELARERGCPLPTYDTRRLRRFVQVGPRCRSVGEFLATFRYFYPVLQDAEALERAAYELCEDQAADRVVYFEARFAPVLLATERFSMEDSVRATLRGLERGCRRFRVRARLLLCCYRPSPPASSVATVKLASAYRDRGVAGIDLAGDERSHSAALHQRAFDLARRLGVPVTIHAGEGGPPANVRDALLLQKARRIGHGVHMTEAPDLVEYVRERGIPIEMCLTSNLQTRIVEAIESHPFGGLLRAGVRVTLNSDDPGVSGITLSDDYRLAVDAWGLSLGELRTIALHGVEAAFVSEDERRTLRRAVEQGYARVATTPRP